MSWRRWLCEYLEKVLIYEDTMVNTAWSSLQRNFSTGVCLSVGKRVYKFDGILGLYRAASSVEHKLRRTLVNKFCGSGLRTDLEAGEGRQGGHYIWSMTKTVPMPQASPSWDDQWSNPLQFASAISTHVLRSTLQLTHKATESKWLEMLTPDTDKLWLTYWLCRSSGKSYQR